MFAIIGIFVVIGAVLTMQSRPTMIKFGAEAFIPGMVAVSVLRELAPDRARKLETRSRASGFQVAMDLG